MRVSNRFCSTVCVVPSTGVVDIGFVVDGSDITQSVRAKLSKITINATKAFVYFIFIDGRCE
jgi:hypothetical protein